MTYGKTKSKRPAVPTEGEMAQWNRLLRYARKLVADPVDIGVGGSFVRAADKVRRYPVPGGKADADNPFIRLVRLGQRWSQILGADRPREVDQLREMIAGCEAFMCEPGSQARQRADVYG